MRQLIALCFVVIGLTNGAFAGNNPHVDKLKGQNTERIQQLSANLSNLRGQLEQDSTAARMDIVEEYLDTALQMVYLAKCNANLSFSDDLETSNSDLQSLIALGYLHEWPLNPLDAWNPMEVSTSKDPGPGNLVFEICPLSEVTTAGDGVYQASFNLYVIAPEGIVFKPVTSSMMGPNKEWSKPPARALYKATFHVGTDREKAEELAKIEEMRKQGLLEPQTVK